MTNTFLGIEISVCIFLFFLGIPVFFLCRWFFKKVIATPGKKRIVTWLATLILTPSIYIGIILLWIFSITYYPKHEFDIEKWAAFKEKRYEFANDLIDNKKLIGKTKDELIEMLGQEDNVKSNDSWNYDLGFKPGLFNIDGDYLDIYFKDEKVAEVKWHQS